MKPTTMRKMQLSNQRDTADAIAYRERFAAVQAQVLREMGERWPAISTADEARAAIEWINTRILELMEKKS